ncbi:MAG TPA: YceI family protein [Rhodothermales bacterium]|nr:YceI family protein [Rhodothermales bacterium]
MFITKRLARLFMLLAFVFLIAACGDVGDAPEAQTQEAVAVADMEGNGLAIDTSRSVIGWKAAKVTRAHDGGFHTFTGTISQAEGEVTGVEVNIDTRSIWSDSGRLTNHLKSEDFFDVEKYPEAQFVADQFVPTDSAHATHLVTGNLTMNGQTQGITFPASITVQNGSVQVAADFILDRTDWGINYTGKADDLIEHEVRMILDVATAPASSNAASSPAE